MSQLDLELVSTALRLLEKRTVAAGEAASLLALVGSREELLAHLLLRRDSLSAHPDIVAAIQRVASSGGREPATPRRQYDDFALSRQAYQQLDDRLKSLVTAAARSIADFSNTESAMRTYYERIAPNWYPQPESRPTTASVEPLAIAAQ